MDFSNLRIATEPTIDSEWKLADYAGAIKVRWSVGRGKYRVEPGLYKLGRPGKDSDVFVSANYKLSFDILRRSLQGIDAWILVLDTKGINVWCAAGKGTFGTNELISRINNANLTTKISHKYIIVPQLGAPGIAAHKVKAATGFSVKFGPVRAADIKAYVQAKYIKTEAMQAVQFNFIDRLILTPVEIVNSFKYLVLILIAILALSGLNLHGYSLHNVSEKGLISVTFILAAYFSGALLGPVLLPVLPFRSFGGKGFVAGILGFTVTYFLISKPILPLSIIALVLISVSISSFLTMNFTGASTYTSLSGVKKEMRIFIPAQIALAVLGFILLILSQFILQNG